MFARSGAVRDVDSDVDAGAPDGAVRDRAVACAERTAAREVEDCTGYEDDGVATGNVVELMETDDAVSLREAATGREVASTTMTMRDDECPMFASFSEGETTTEWHSFDADALSAFLQPCVTP